jgi:hypothetical protein
MSRKAARKKRTMMLTGHGFIVMAAATWLLLSSCGFGSGADSQSSVFDAEYTLSAAEGLQQSVVVDSVRWNPAAFDFPTPGLLEVTGLYEIHFRSVWDEKLEMSYDLRFLDRDGFLFDQFIPFGLPVVFEPGQALVESGQFEISSTELGLQDVRTMRIAASVQVIAGP